MFSYQIKGVVNSIECIIFYALFFFFANLCSFWHFHPAFIWIFLFEIPKCT